MTHIIESHKLQEMLAAAKEQGRRESCMDAKRYQWLTQEVCHATQNDLWNRQRDMANALPVRPKYALDRDIDYWMAQFSDGKHTLGECQCEAIGDAEPVAWLFADRTWTHIPAMAADHGGKPVHLAPPRALLMRVAMEVARTTWGLSGEGHNAEHGCWGGLPDDLDLSAIVSRIAGEQK